MHRERGKKVDYLVLKSKILIFKFIVWKAFLLVPHFSQYNAVLALASRRVSCRYSSSKALQVEKATETTLLVAMRGCLVDNVPHPPQYQAVQTLRRALQVTSS